MEKEKKSIGILMATLPIASSIIWGAVIIGCSLKLKGTNGYDEIQNILYAGVTMHILMIGGVIGAIAGKKKKEAQEQASK